MELPAGTVGELLRNEGYATIKHYSEYLDSLDEVNDGYGYSKATDGTNVSGVFLSLFHLKTRLQIKSDINSTSLFIRTSNFNGDFKEWRKI